VTKPWLFFGGTEGDLTSKIEGLKRFADAQLR